MFSPHLAPGTHSPFPTLHMTHDPHSPPGTHSPLPIWHLDHTFHSPPGTWHTLTPPHLEIGTNFPLPTWHLAHTDLCPPGTWHALISVHLAPVTPCPPFLHLPTTQGPSGSSQAGVLSPLSLSLWQGQVTWAGTTDSLLQFPEAKNVTTYSVSFESFHKCVWLS